MNTEEKIYYINVTKKRLQKVRKNNSKVEEQKYYIVNKKVYKVDGKNVVLDYSKNEKNVACWLVKTFGGKIKLLPRVNYPESIKTPDYLFNGKKFDLKQIYGTSKRVIDDALKKQKNQASNFIIDIVNKKININEIISQTEKIYITKGREWINIIIIIKDYNLIAVYQRK